MRATNRQPRRANASARAHAVGKAATPANGAAGAPQANAEPAPRVNGTARKRSPTKPKTANHPTVEVTANQELAGFPPARIQPVDAEMWPVQPVIWLQPEWKPGPTSSDLSIERHHRIPVPGFLNVATGRGYSLICNPGGLAAGLSSAPPASLPKVSLTSPESGLTLLGWDPRSVVPLVKENRSADAARSSGKNASARRSPAEGEE
jgi:hypothetical protein